MRTASAGFKSNYLVFAFGGKAAKQYGTNGASYALAESFGHTVTKLYPSLVQLRTELKNIRGLKGIKTEAVVTAYGDGVTFSRGDVLFTEYGVSGSAVFAVSGAVTKGGRLEIEFLPDFTAEEIERMIAARVKLGYSGAEVTGGLIHKQLGRAVFALSDGTIENIAAVMKRFPLKVTGTLGFDYAQVTKGRRQRKRNRPRNHDEQFKQ